MAIETSTAAAAGHVPAGYEFISGVSDRVSDYLELETWVSPGGLTLDELESVRRPFEWEEVTAIAVEGDSPDVKPQRFTGLAGSSVTDLFRHFPVPGGSVVAARLSQVGVHPNHRRRGLMAAMVAKHLRDATHSKCGVSVLSTSNSTLYGRYGYAPVVSELMVTIPAGICLSGTRDSSGLSIHIEDVVEEYHSALVREVHNTAGENPCGVPGLNRPGWVGRETSAMEEFFWDDSSAFRNGGEPMRIVVVQDAERPRAYARFRRSYDPDLLHPGGMIAVGEAVALDNTAAGALWSALLGLDETSEVIPNGIPSDDHLFNLLPAVRKTAASVDALWLRIVDVQRALTARRYVADIDIVIRVNDHALSDNSGTWRLTARAHESANCEPVDEDPDLTIGVQELATVYMGRKSLATLAMHGSVAFSEIDKLSSASVAFGWPISPAISWRI